jgi:hypothetical protein
MRPPIIVQQREKDTPATHRMEYIYRIFIDNIIQDFEDITIAVKTQQKMLVPGIVQHIIVKSIHKGISDVSLAHTVFKSGRIELDDNVHVSSILFSVCMMNPLLP